jgi:two-component system, sensor histidine kinase
MQTPQSLSSGSTPRDVEIETAERFLNPWVTLMGQVFFVATLGLLFLLFKDVVPEKPLNQWKALAILVSIVTFGFIFAFIVRRPGKAEILRFWRPLDRLLPQTYDLVSIAAVFLLLPHADMSRMILFAAFCVGYVPMQVLSDPENTWGNQVSIVGLLGAFALQLLLLPGWHTDVLAGMVFVYGSVMVIAARSLRRIVRQAVSARREVEKTAQALELAVKQVSAERDARSRFLTAASHDLGQPLHAASLFLDDLEFATTRQTRVECAARVGEAVNAARSIVGDLLSHARLEADAVKPNLRVYRVGALIGEVAAMFEPLARAHNIAIRWVDCSQVIETDSSLFKRALGNLVSNAIIHSQGTRILIGARSSLHCATPNRIRILVADDGIGITHKDRLAIFEDFTQLGQGKQGYQGGFGLGLASVRRIAALLGGQSTVSEVGSRGVMFCMHL